MSDPGQSSPSKDVIALVSKAKSGPVDAFEDMPKEKFAKAIKRAKKKNNKQKGPAPSVPGLAPQPAERKHVEKEPYELHGGIIVTKGGSQITHVSGNKTFVFTPRHGLILAKVKGEDLWYFAKTSSKPRIEADDAEITNGRLKSKGGEVIVPDTSGASLNARDYYQHKGLAIKWQGGRDVYNFCFTGAKIVAVPVKGGSKTVLDAQSENHQSLRFGDLTISGSKAVTLDDEEIFPQGKGTRRPPESKKLPKPPEEVEEPPARVELDSGTGALTYQGKQLSVNGCDLYFDATDGLYADGDYFVVDSSGADVTTWRKLDVPSDCRLPQSGGRLLDLRDWTFKFGVCIAIPDKYADDAIKEVAKALRLNWETRVGQAVATRNIGYADGYRAHLSIVQADLRRAVVHGMGVGRTQVRVLEDVPYHVTVETTRRRNNPNNARYYSYGNTSTGWSKIPVDATIKEYENVLSVAIGIMGHS